MMMRMWLERLFFAKMMMMALKQEEAGHTCTSITHKGITKPNFIILDLLSVILIPKLPNRFVPGIQ